MLTCNRLDLQTPGSQPVNLCSKISPTTGNENTMESMIGENRQQLVTDEPVEFEK